MTPTKFLFDTLYKTLNMNEQQNKETEEIVAQNPQICLLQQFSSTEYDDNFSFGFDSKDLFSNKQFLDIGYVNAGFEEEIPNNLSNYARYLFSVTYLFNVILYCQQTNRKLLILSLSIIEIQQDE